MGTGMTTSQINHANRIRSARGLPPAGAYNAPTNFSLRKSPKIGEGTGAVVRELFDEQGNSLNMVARSEGVQNLNKTVKYALMHEVVKGVRTEKPGALANARTVEILDAEVGTRFPVTGNELTRFEGYYDKYIRNKAVATTTSEDASPEDKEAAAAANKTGMCGFVHGADPERDQRIADKTATLFMAKAPVWLTELEKGEKHSPEKRREIAKGVAHTARALHAQGIVAGFTHAGNILLNKKDKPVFCDFVDWSIIPGSPAAAVLDKVVKQSVEAVQTPGKANGSPLLAALLHGADNPEALLKDAKEAFVLTSETQDAAAGQAAEYLRETVKMTLTGETPPEAYYREDQRKRFDKQSVTLSRLPEALASLDRFEIYS